MKTKILLGILTMAASSMLAADSNAKEEAATAAKKLADQDNYAWKSSNQFANFSSSTEGKADKNGLIHLAVTLRRQYYRGIFESWQGRGKAA